MRLKLLSMKASDYILRHDTQAKGVRLGRYGMFVCVDFVFPPIVETLKERPTSIQSVFDILMSSQRQVASRQFPDTIDSTKTEKMS